MIQNASAPIRARKADHLDLCATDAVAFRSRTTLLEEVHLHHQSLPEVALSEIDTSATLLGQSLRAPIVIAGMTGGHERAREVNRGLARVAERRGYAFGLGSQRAMLRDPSLAATYDVRDVAPNVALFGNIGVVQARDLSTEEIRSLVDSVGASALCVHLNPAMEIVQPGGDEDFRGGVETFSRLVADLGVPIIAKETGNGISARTAAALWMAGVRAVDVSGAGGTSWVGVEALRADEDTRALGELLWDWGIPTAASVAIAARVGHETIATGGIATGLDVARAIRLGASAAGIARRVFQAFVDGGEQGAERYLLRVERELRAVMLLTGARNLSELRAVPAHLGPDLARWLASDPRPGAGMAPQQTSRPRNLGAASANGSAT